VTDIRRREMMAGAIPVGFLGGLFKRAAIGQPAPPFTVHTFDGRKASLEDLFGRVILLNFWATWCAPCRNELPLLADYARRHASDGFMFFAINALDAVTNADLKKVATVSAWPIAMRFSGAGYGDLGALPTNYVIDRAGIVRYAKTGAFEEDTLNAVVTPLLNARAPTTAKTTGT
jgi:cytochrome c biogenesis protein CcmG/thiol:disulfide interchange protein DsbE